MPREIDLERGGSVWDSTQERAKAFQISDDRKIAKNAKISFGTAPLKVFGLLFNHPYPLDLSIQKFCHQGCTYCFSMANRKANEDTVGAAKDPTDLVIRNSVKDFRG